MSIEEIKKAINKGKSVFWHHEGYEVIRDKFNRYLIYCHMNSHCIGLHGLEGTEYENVLNGDEKEFYIAYNVNKH